MVTYGWGASTAASCLMTGKLLLTTNFKILSPTCCQKMGWPYVFKFWLLSMLKCMQKNDVLSGSGHIHSLLDWNDLNWPVAEMQLWSWHTIQTLQLFCLVDIVVFFEPLMHVLSNYQDFWGYSMLNLSSWVTTIPKSTRLKAAKMNERECGHFVLQVQVKGNIIVKIPSRSELSVSILLTLSCQLS